MGRTWLTPKFPQDIHSPTQSLSSSLNAKIKGFVFINLNVLGAFSEKKKVYQSQIVHLTKEIINWCTKNQVNIKCHRPKPPQAQVRGQFDHYALLTPDLTPDLQNLKFYLGHLHNPVYKIKLQVHIKSGKIQISEFYDYSTLT